MCNFHAVVLQRIFGLGALALLPAWASAQSPNVALGRPYTLSPPPNYSLTTDAGDSVQLTDGAYTLNDPIWTRTSTVGWSTAAPVTIVIDLQSIQPIAGVVYSTAAGKSGVQWPRSIFVLTSDDGVHYYFAVDLALGNAASGPPPSGYAAFRYRSMNLHTHGRYVALIIDPNGLYTFCDEIQVLGGDASWLGAPLTGPSTTNLQTFFISAHMGVSIERRLRSDLQAAQVALAASSLDDGLRARLTSTLDDAAIDIPTFSLPDPTSFKAVLPLNDLHARILSVQGAIAGAEGLPPLAAWAVNPWDFVRPLDKPSGGTGSVRIAAMNGETRAGAINLANSTEASTTASLQVVGTGSSVDVRLYQAEWTDTRELIPVADALIPLSADGAITIPAGMTRQVWLQFTPRNRQPGVYSGYVEARAGGAVVARVPYEATVLAGAAPVRPTLHLGGWDYTDRVNYLGITPGNQAALIAQLQALNVDSPWATSSVMPPGTFDSVGRLVQQPDTTAFDRWIGRWPNASRYYIYLSAPAVIGNISTGSPLFTAAVGQWINFWVIHASQLGIRPDQLMLLLVDEPSSSTQDDRIVVWAKAIKTAQPNVGIWEDPTFADPATALPHLLDVADVVALKRSLIQQQGAAFTSFYEAWASGTKALNVYGADGPARLLDPYSYDRLQAWICAATGSTVSLFWSFADDAGGTSWNEYRAIQAPFSPFFLSSTDVTISKHSEAIREGVEDFEYLTLLRQQIGSAAVGSAIAAVLGAAQADDIMWATAKDRSNADAVRLQIATALGLLPAQPAASKGFTGD